MIFNINSPSLRSLSIDNSKGKRAYVDKNHGFVINAPSLEKMDFKDTFSNSLVFEHMPEVIEANIQVICGQSENFTGSLTSIRHLSFCSLSSEQHGAHYNDPMILWKEPTSVPECLSTHLEIMEWRQYEGTEQERNLAAYIPANATYQTKGENAMFKDVPDWFYLPSLKSLHLLSVIFSGDESLSKLIQRCPVLEDLVINKTRDDNVMIFNINSPSLRSLSIDNSIGQRAYVMENHGFVINAPFLEKINFKDTFSNFLVFEHMPEVIEANVQVICGQSNKFIGSLTSIRHLSFCSLSSETPYPSGTTFPYLEHLELCTCSAGWANLLVCILKDAPTIKHLKLKSLIYEKLPKDIASLDHVLALGNSAVNALSLLISKGAWENSQTVTLVQTTKVKGGEATPDIHSLKSLTHQEQRRMKVAAGLNESMEQRP
ncbi:hypothetical protein Bca52824_004408 [Brassica carinata]|uniref:FBD domain-containing protein n=1 Tax=Brassica carinata TaxID=52824 RepID=A0A8X7WLU8_BRACI|nr:hypothetical protein Bca52824_004408 [Brassica carinata]